MQIPMILFTIIIERRIVTPEELANQYKQENRIKQLEEKRWEQLAQLPEYCTRM